VKQQNAEQVDETEENGKETRVPVGQNRDGGDDEECADEISTDGAAGSPGRDGRESAGVMAVKKVLDTENAERNGEEVATELREAFHR